jgi:cellobiose phosphorylase
VYVQTIAGRDTPKHGEAKNSWLSGTAAWNYVAITQWLLGIRPDYEGLRIAPVIPTNWSDFKVQRKFRGTTYHITISRAGHGNSVTLVVDGKPIAGNVVPLPSSGVMDVTIDVTLT